MAQFLNAFQDTAGHLPQAVLLYVGFVLGWLGLCLWLGGLRWLKFFAGFTVAGIAYGVTSHYTDQFYFVVGAAVLAGLVAILFEKTTVVLLSAVLTSVIVCLVLAWPAFSSPQIWQNPPAADTSNASSSQTVIQSLTVLEKYVQWIGQNISKTLIQSFGPAAWTAIAIVMLVFAGLGFIFPRGLCALTCAIIGMVIIAFGMFFLLLFKGSRPADIVSANPALFEIIAAGMVAFGVLINLAVAPAKKHGKSVKSDDLI